MAELFTSTESLSTFSKAIEAAGLVDTFNEVGTYTIFAPNNDAFESIPSSTLTQLLEPEDETYVEKIKKYVLRGVLDSSAPILSKDFPHITIRLNNMAEEEITVLNERKDNSNFQILVAHGTSLSNPGRVIESDIIASNGVVHIIDGCIGPVP